MNLKDLANLVSPRELNKIKARVNKMNPKQIEEELKLRLGQFKDLTQKSEEEKKDETNI